MNPVLQAVVASAVESCGASHGWIVVPRGDTLEVAAASGDGALVGGAVRGEGATAAYVLASGQPVAMVPRADDPGRGEGVAALLGVLPSAVLCVPCTAGDDVVGALELIDKTGGGGFSFDDVEVATILGNVAGAALLGGQAAPPARSPDELAADLRGLVVSDPAGYQAVATVIEALLARG